MNTRTAERKVVCLSQNCEYEFEETWYDSATPEHFWQKFRFEVLIDAMRKSGLDFGSELEALDIGGGRGVFRHQLEERTQWKVDCADLDQSALTHSYGCKGQNFYYNVFDQNKDLVGKYDLLFMLDVVEHLPNPTEFVSACLKHLKEGGVFVINVPAHQWLFSNYDKAAGHFRRYNLADLKAILPKGAKVVKAGYWGLAMIPLLLVRRLLMFFFSSTEKILRTGFKPPAPIIGRIMLAWFRLDRRIISNPPLGTSAYIIGKCDSL